MGGVCVWDFVLFFLKSFHGRFQVLKKPPRNLGSLVSENYSEVQKLHCCPPGTPQDRIDPVNKHCGFLLALSHASTEAQSLL